jgi:hypothetical protein
VTIGNLLDKPRYINVTAIANDMNQQKIDDPNRHMSISLSEACESNENPRNRITINEKDSDALIRSVSPKFEDATPVMMVEGISSPINLKLEDHNIPSDDLPYALAKCPESAANPITANIIKNTAITIESPQLTDIRSTETIRSSNISIKEIAVTKIAQTLAILSILTQLQSGLRFEAGGGWTIIV